MSHGGGAIPYQRGRFQPGALRAGTTFEEQMRKLYYDTCLYTRDSIELLLRAVGIDRCLFGTEKPGTGSTRDPQTGRWIDDIHLLIEDIDWLDDGQREATVRDQRPRAVPHLTVQERQPWQRSPSASGPRTRPQLSTPPEQWAQRAAADHRNPALALPRHATTPTPSSATCATPRSRRSASPACSASAMPAAAPQSRELGGIIRAANIDVLVVVSSDHKELYGDELLPQFAIYWGDTMRHEPYTAQQLASMPPGLAVAEVANQPEQPDSQARARRAGPAPDSRRSAAPGSTRPRRMCFPQASGKTTASRTAGDSSSSRCSAATT